ncbi:holin [Acinetobacter sp. YH1901134]|uniref:holin n=1 Tax=Acinetobacter sp. YH1901134 TaxID=2601199 RepID=UPI0015D2567C|nr:holin [Acinetobacter sp. YH1901134]
MSSEHVQTAIETSAAVTSGAAKTTFVAGGGAVAGKWLGLDPITAIGLIVGVGGLIISILGFLVNWYYKAKDERRKAELHEFQVHKTAGQCNGKT